jgi:hypothetical protein
MLGFLASLVAVGGFIAFACHDADEPMVKPAWLKLKLVRLVKRINSHKITLDEAEDGMVLSRKLGEKGLEKRFAVVATRLRTHRPRR